MLHGAILRSPYAHARIVSIDTSAAEAHPKVGACGPSPLHQMTMRADYLVDGVDDLTVRLADAGYLVDDGLATALTLAVRLRQPLLLEGEAGVGKTQAAKSLSAALQSPLIRLQWYEGVELSDALYEWNYPRQLLAIRLAETSGDKLSDTDLFTSDYLVERPVLRRFVIRGRAQRFFSSTKSIVPTMNSKRSFLRCWPNRR